MRTITRRVALRYPSRKKDSVTPEVREFVLNRDKRCFANRIERGHVCRDRWGIVHSPDRLDLLTLDHVLEAARMGRRAPSDPAHLVAMCWDANVNGWASAHRIEERSYLAAVSEHVHVEPVPGCPSCYEAFG